MLLLIPKDIKDKSHLFSYLGEAYRREKLPPLHVFTLLLAEDLTLDEAFEHARRRGLRANIEARSGDLFLVGLGVRTSYETGYLVPIDDSWIFVSDAATGKLTSTVQAFARVLSPVVELAYVPSEMVLGVISRSCKNYDSVLVTEGTIGTEDETFRNWKREPVGFTPQRMEQMARREEGKWTGISLKGIRQGQDAVRCRLHERGHLTFYGGDFGRFYSDFLLPYLAEFLQVRNRLAKKGRRQSHGEVTLNPVTLNFRDKLSLLMMQQLTTRLVSRYTAAVTHPGNPLLVMHLSDRNDGSLYDLYAYDRKVDIVPLAEGRPGSLGELISVVSDVLPSGKPEVV